MKNLQKIHAQSSQILKATKNLQKPRDIERYTKDYIHSDNDFEAVMVHYRRQKVLEILHHYKPKRILEIGCGVQASFDFYQEYEKFVVVEPSKEFCKMISNSKHKNAKVSIINDFLENQIPTLEKQEFDFILLSGLLHELNSPLDFLKSLRKLCGEDTILHINVPNNKSFHLLWAYEAGLIKHIGQLTSTAVKMQQNSAFDAQSLAQIVQKAGFDINGGGTYFMKPFNHKKMAELMRLGIIDEALLDGLNKLAKYFPENGAEIFVNCRKSK